MVTPNSDQPAGNQDLGFGFNTLRVLLLPPTHPLQSMPAGCPSAIQLKIRLILFSHFIRLDGEAF
jgi:hypothetical protein